MNLRSQLLAQLSMLRTATTALNEAIDALDAINPPQTNSPTLELLDAPHEGLFTGATDDKT